MVSGYQPEVGHLVLVHDPRLAEQLGRAGEVGTVINTRRNGARVVFLPDRATYWIEPHRLFPHPDPGAHCSIAEQNIAAALAILQPEEAELESVSGGVELVALAVALTDTKLEELRSRLGDQLLGWKVVPYGMALITVNLRLRA